MPRRNKRARSRPGRSGNKTARLERQLLEMQRAARGLWPDTGEDPQGPGDDEAAGHHQVAAARAGETN